MIKQKRFQYNTQFKPVIKHAEYQKAGIFSLGELVSPSILYEWKDFWNDVDKFLATVSDDKVINICESWTCASRIGDCGIFNLTIWYKE